MKLFLSFALAIASFGQPVPPSVFIDAGSSSDAWFSSLPAYPTAVYTIPSTVIFQPAGTNDSTLRYGQHFTYSFDLIQSGLYIIQLNLIEPTYQIVGQRIFSVSINNQPFLQNIDLFNEAGYLIPMVKAFTGYLPQAHIKITFDSMIAGRNAVINSIVATPLGIALFPSLLVNPNRVIQPFGLLGGD